MIEEIEEKSDRLDFAVYTVFVVGPIVVSGAATPAWLAGTLNLAKDFRASRSAAGSHFEFWLSRPQSLVA